jgi:hypothetical protein
VVGDQNSKSSIVNDLLLFGKGFFSILYNIIADQVVKFKQFA